MSSVNKNTFGELSSAPDNSIINCIYAYINSVIQDFKGKNDENENNLTNRLCKALSSKKPAEYSFYFHHQNLEDGNVNTSTDFAAFGTFAYTQANNIEDDGNGFPLVKFEAKRLCSTLPNKREREYVIGEYKNGECIKNSGGIERFKNGRHGKDVIHIGIIGYVQSDSFIHWFEQVNNWINDEINMPHDKNLSWDIDDLLVLNQLENKICIYNSKSKRHSGDTLYLKHIWINLI